MTFRVVLAPPARRALEFALPEGVAAAAWEFINGALAENPHRVGKPLTGELTGLWSARRGLFVASRIQATKVRELRFSVSA